MPQYYYTPPGFNNYGTSYADDERARAQRELLLRQRREKSELRRFGIFLGLATISYLLIQVLLAAGLQAVGLYDLFTSNTIFQYAVTIVGVSFCAVALPFLIVALINRKRYCYPIVPNKKISPSRCIAWVLFGLGCCSASNIAVNYVIQLVKTVFNRQLTQGDTAKPSNVVECLFELIAIAVIPAICEELAMRCCALQLLRKYGASFAIVTVSVVFGLLHGNVIQFLFAFLVGLVLAYVTVKTQSIVPAIFIHMLNNGLSVIQDLLRLLASQKASEYFVSVIFIVFIVGAIASAVYLFFKKEFSIRLDKGNTVLSTGEKIKAFFFPGMIVPFVALILLTLTTIKKM